jgi:hypothetical protein
LLRGRQGPEPDGAPDLITVRGHRRPRLYRATTIHPYKEDIIVR